jgi:Ras-related protein Rab-1A
LIIGDSAVGKSCLLIQFADQTFSENYVSTIGVDFKIRTMELDGKSIKLQIWDTAGQERFRSITSNYYNGSHAIAIVYDITNRQSFENIRKWMNDVQNLANPNFCKLLVGNKIDLEEKSVVRKGEGQQMADSLGIPFIETSAKSTENVQELFTQMCREVSRRQDNQPKKGPLPSPRPVLVKGTTVRRDEGGCGC